MLDCRDDNIIDLAIRSSWIDL